jgi:hypothetical protein
MSEKMPINIQINRTHCQKLGVLGVLTAAILFLTGCVVTPLYQTRIVTTQQASPVVVGAANTPATVNANVEYVQTAPPAPQYEVVTVSPGVGYVWTPGLWYWYGGRHVWRAGVWQRPPSGYNHWNHGGWYHTPGRGWYHNGGHWR